MIVLYFFIGFIATSIGAITGIGGGVIIKPVLDAIGTYDAGTVSTLSSATVFAMAAVSLLKKKRSKIELDWKVSSLLALGSTIGGISGKAIFNQLLEHIDNSDITLIQSSILVLLLGLILFNSLKKFRSFHMTAPFMIIVVGLVLGLLSAFLGIGGGPLNVAVLIFVFSMGIKDATINSILIIFFSQLSTLITIFFSTGFGIFDLSMIPYMIGGGVLGGYVGSILARRFGSGKVESLFNVTLIVIIMINVFTIGRVIF
ncbi:sulfite exporter TauE/SafE family protein [Rossellomorea oryzaecorticis]|uniref:Probable membrane transporter protein n=1 Tax=Rossellomorea oryzaecorticis TaxID=1396505 RepID=A0ABU9K888_9BACI